MSGSFFNRVKTNVKKRLLQRCRFLYSSLNVPQHNVAVLTISDSQFGLFPRRMLRIMTNEFHQLIVICYRHQLGPLPYGVYYPDDLGPLDYMRTNIFMIFAHHMDNKPNHKPLILSPAYILFDFIMRTPSQL